MNVRDYMNTHVVYLRAGDRVELARTPMLDFGLTAIPILDDEHRPVGMVTLRDLADERQSHPHVTKRVFTVAADASLEVAGRALADADLHHLVVVDGEGKALGMLSSLDVVRGLVGVESKHPPSIRRFVAASEPKDLQS